MFPEVSNGMNWYLTFGNSADPTANPTFYTAGENVDWAKEVEINRSGTYLGVVKSSGTLSLCYVGAFPLSSL